MAEPKVAVTWALSAPPTNPHVEMFKGQFSSANMHMAFAKRSQELEPVDISEALGHDDLGGLVLEHLSLAELASVADAQPSLLPKITALEERWLRGCVDVCGGTLDWLKTWQHSIDKDGALLAAGCANDWMTAWRTLHGLRTAFLSATLPKCNGNLCLPTTLPWGSEKWTRMNNLPQEEEMRDALARCALYHASIVEGCGDPQMDTYPVGIAFYQRTGASDVFKKDEDGDMNEDAIEAAIVQVREAFYPECDEDFVNDVHECVMEPISINALLANLPSPVHVPDNRRPISGMGCRLLERAIFEAAAGCSRFVKLCVGKAPALTPAQALEVLRGTCDVIIKEGCDGMDDSQWDVPMGETGKYDEDEEYIETLGINLVERALKAQLAAVPVANHHKGLSAATTADAALGLQWTADMTGVQNVQHAITRPLASHKAELAKLIEVQLRAVAGDGALDAPTVRPVMLTSSDVMTRYWSDAKNGDNDHEGVPAMAFVGETWVLMVVAKCASC